MTLFANTSLVGVVCEEIPENIIGKRLAFTQKFSEKGISYEILGSALEEAGLSKYIPKKPCAVDVFRRACQDISKGYIEDYSREKKYKLNMIIIDETGDPVIRNVQITEVDKSEKESTDGIVIAKLKFTRETENFIVEYTPAVERFPFFTVEKIEKARAKYYEIMNTISDSQLRNIIYKIMSDIGTPVRGINSLWTVPAVPEKMALLNSLVVFFEKYNEYEEIFFFDVLPVIRSEEITKKVRTDAIHYALERLNKKEEEIRKAVAFAQNPDAVGEKNLKRLEAEIEEILKLIEEYETVLGEAFDEVRQAKTITLAKTKEFITSPQKQAEYREQSKRVIRTAKNDNTLAKESNDSALANRRVLRM